MSNEALFTKMHGTGNDFLLTDLRQTEQEKILLQQYGCDSLANLSQKLCARHFNVGADGVVFIKSPPKKSSDLLFQWDFYNSDGSSAEMCGNAARCAAIFAMHIGMTKQTKFSFGTLAGTITAEVYDDDQVAVTMSKSQWLKSPQQTIDLEDLSFCLIDSGVPHAVAEVKNLEADFLRPSCEAIGTRNPIFTANGANLTFFKPVSAQKIESVTFERGVDDFTLACGTGAVAAAMTYLELAKPPSQKITVTVPGGTLQVDLSTENPTLIGPVVKVAEIKTIS